MCPNKNLAKEVVYKMMREDALKAFEMWDNKVDKVKY